MDISQSKLKTWRTCRQQYYYKYGMRITKKNKPYAFMRGTIIHDVLEAHYLKKDPWKPFKQHMKDHEKLFRVEREEYGDMPHDLKFLLEGYFAFYKRDELEPHKVEHEFRVKLFTGTFFTGKIDMVAQYKQKKVIAEHKCHNRIPSGSLVPYTNLQAAGYTWAWEEETGEKVQGVLWNYLWGKPPTRPKLLKSGEMSKRNIDTTWPMYRSALKEAGLDPEDYFDMREQLRGNEQHFYQRKLLPVNKTMRSNIVEDIKTTAREMEKHANKDKTRNLGRHCDFCEFKHLCLTQLQGLDDNYILKAEFKERKKDEQVLEHQQED